MMMTDKIMVDTVETEEDPQEEVATEAVEVTEMIVSLAVEVAEVEVSE